MDQTAELQELRELEARRCAAISASDLEALKSLLSDDYVHVHMNGHVDDRAGHLNGVAARPRLVQRGELSVRLYGELAVLTGTLNNQMALPGGEARRVEAYCQQVAVRRDGQWRFVSIQLTPITPS